MAFDKMRITEYYALRKETFSIDPINDSAQYFGNEKLSDRLRSRIESDFAQARAVPKFYILGDFGAGKTHTLLHIAHVLEHDILEECAPIYLDIAPLRHKERFATLQNRMLDAIGLDAIAASAESVASNVKGDKATGIQELLRFGDTTLKNSQGNVFRNILFGGRQRQLSWEWLKGATLSGSDRESLQVTKTLTQPGEFVHVLLNTAVLYRAGTDRRIVFLLDEVEATRDVTDGDSLAELEFGFRELFDDTNNIMGLIAAIQAEGGTEIGDLMSREAIFRRIGRETGVFDLTSLVREPLQLQKFIDELLHYLIDRSKAAEIVATEQLDCKAEHFPFSESALVALNEGLQSQPELLKPSGIIQTMATAAIEGWRRRYHSQTRIVVTPEIIEEVLYPGRG